MFVITCSNKVECPRLLTNDSRRFGDHDNLQLQSAWYDRHGRRHNFEIESDRAERSFIKELVEARYPTDRVVINNVSQKR